MNNRINSEVKPEKKLSLAAKVAAGAGIVLAAAALFAAKFILSGNTQFCSDDENNDVNITPDAADYSKETESEDEPEYTSHIRKEYNRYIPSGCNACGGPYPLCKMGCPVFDDE